MTWMATPDGFWSIVQARDDWNTLCVRTRVKADLLPLIDYAATRSVTLEVVVYDHSDYPWRVLAPRRIVAEFAMKQIWSLDYGNFKAAVEKRQGKKRHDVYSRVWSALLGLERLDPEIKPAPVRLRDYWEPDPDDELFDSGAFRELYVEAQEPPSFGSSYGGEWWLDAELDHAADAEAERLQREHDAAIVRQNGNVTSEARRKARKRRHRRGRRR